MATVPSVVRLRVRVLALEYLRERWQRSRVGDRRRGPNQSFESFVADYLETAVVTECVAAGIPLARGRRREERS